MTTNDIFPEIPEALLDKLNALYPDRCPKLTDDEREIWFNTGQRSVVNFLKFKKMERDTHDPLPLTLS